MFFTPTISVLAMMLQPANRRRPATTGIMVLFAVGIHLLGMRGLINNFLNLTDSNALIAMIISTLVTLLLGGALGLLLQEMHTNKS